MLSARSVILVLVLSATSAFAGWTTPPFPTPDYFRTDDAKMDRMWQVWSASVERAWAAGITNPATAPAYRKERQFLVDWKKWVTNAMRSYADQTVFFGSGQTNFHTMPYIKALSHDMVIDWIDGAGARIPTNYFEYTPWRQLNGEGIPLSNANTQVGYSTLDYGYVHVTNILAMMTWTIVSNPTTQGITFPTNEFGQSLTAWGEPTDACAVGWSSYAAAQAGADACPYFASGVGQVPAPHWGTAAFYYESDSSGTTNYYLADQVANRFNYRETVYTGMQCKADLYYYPIAAWSRGTNPLAANFDFNAKGFNLVETNISHVSTTDKPVGTNAFLVTFDATGAGAWHPDDPATHGLEFFDDPPEASPLHGYANGWGFAATRTWIILRWDATADGFKYR